MIESTHPDLITDFSWPTFYCATSYKKSIRTKSARYTNLQRPNQTDFQNLTETWRFQYSREKARGRHANVNEKQTHYRSGQVLRGAHPVYKMLI
jgi:glucose dehydrogenase